jgi:hypothetical protein
MEEASNSESCHTSSLAKFFDKEMLKEFVTMRNMMQEMWGDRKERIFLQEQLMAMKEEKHQLLEKLHDMETQSMRKKKPLPSTCMNMRYVMLVFLQIPLKLNALVFLKIILEE